MNSNRNTRILARSLMTLALMAMLVLFSDPALAWGKKKKKEKKEEPAKAVNLNQHPSMKIYRGVLRTGARGEWLLDKHPLSFNRNSRISDTPDSEGGTALVEGREAKVTAANIGGTLVVHRVTMLSSREMMERGHYNSGGMGDEPDRASPDLPQ